MNTNEVSKNIVLRVGIFTCLGIALIGVLTVFVNDRPFWWRKCEPVFINVDDATGLKQKSPIRSLGLQIGYLRSVELSETHVKLGICITAPVRIIPETRAYIKGEGFLGDKFVELKPVQYTGQGGSTEVVPATSNSSNSSVPSPKQEREPSSAQPLEMKVEIEKELAPSFSTQSFFNWLIPSAHAVDREVPVGAKQSDMDKMMDTADKMMVEMTELTKNLKEGLNPKELRTTIQQLNKTLEAASKTLSPEGGLNSTARRALEKLEDAFEQLRQQMTRINKGEGSMGKLLNDPVYAEELLKAAKSLNKLLNKTVDVRFLVNVGAEQIQAYDGGRGFFQLGIWPTKERYYLVGITLDPRGKRKVTNTTTTSGGSSTAYSVEEIEEGGLLITGMLGKVFFNRLDLSIGSLHGDGALSVGLYAGPKNWEDTIVLRNDVYSRGRGIALNNRTTLTVRPFAMFEGMSSVYIKGGLESFRKVNGKTAFMYGAGVSFDDEDIKLLFAFM